MSDTDLEQSRRHFEAEKQCESAIFNRLRMLVNMTDEERRDAPLYVNGAILKAAKALVALDGR